MPPRRLLLVCLLALAAPVLRAEPAALPKKEISDKTSASLGKLRTLTEAKDYAGSLALVDGLLTTAAPESFDAYVLNQIKAQILLTQGKLIEAIPPLETGLALGDGNPNFIDASTRLEQLYLLAQLHYQRAADSKDSLAQKAGYEKGLGYINRRLELNPNAGPDVRLFAASLLYQLGTLDPAKTDTPRIREAITHASEGLLLSVKPSNQLYLILVAGYIQLGENARAAEILEILAVRDPKNAATWSQLQSIYLAGAAETKDPAEARALNLRALHVLDRAQAIGQLNTPKDNYTRVAILFNLDLFGRAAEGMEKGFTDGTLEASKRNWELLASAYQQLHQDAKALDTLTRAAARFPQDASLEFSLAQLLYGTGNVTDAYTRAKSALSKGLEKPGQARSYLAYLAYELQRYEEALEWIAQARADGTVSASTLDPLAAAINEAIAARQKATRS